VETIGALISLVDLICKYIQEKKDQKDRTGQDFLDWLGSQRHQHIINSISRNNALLGAIDDYLKLGYDSISQQLLGIDDMLASLLSRIDGLDNIVQAVKPNCELSEQAISILRQLIESTSESFFIIPHRGQNLLVLHQGAYIEITEQKFVKDDLNTLVKLHLLNHLGYNNNGNDIYGITRNAKKLIDLTDSKT